MTATNDNFPTVSLNQQTVVFKKKKFPDAFNQHVI